MKGGPLPTGDCHKGGMACEKQCPDVGRSRSLKQKPVCSTVMEKVCEDVKKPKCNAVVEPVCEPVREQVCDDSNDKQEPQTR
jgi:hypothetical protein